jgi:glycosyltransferase involved in cell wall biosynthesis
MRRNTSGPSDGRRQVSVSIVICTKNRAEQLGACLDAISRIDSAVPWELVVVDNASSDNTRAVLDRFARTASFPVTVLCEPTAGVGWAKNTGWSAASGEFIGFTDDDCYVEPDYPDRVCDLVLQPEVGLGGGRITLHDPADYPITIQLLADRVVVPPRNIVRAGLIKGANMAFRRAVLSQIGGFDPTFGPGAKFYGEEIDALTRASFAGWHGLYDPRLSLAHHHRRKAADAHKLRRVYALGRGACYMKFMLCRDSRLKVCKHLYWDYWPALRGGRMNWRSLFYVLQGAIGYAGFRLYTVIFGRDGPKLANAQQPRPK